MFARPQTAASQDSLASHVFGRFLPRPAPAVVVSQGAMPAANDEISVATPAGDDLPDLAQRVRESGEW